MDYRRGNKTRLRLSAHRKKRKYFEHYKNKYRLNGRFASKIAYSQATSGAVGETAEHSPLGNIVQEPTVGQLLLQLDEKQERNALSTFANTRKIEMSNLPSSTVLQAAFVPPDAINTNVRIVKDNCAYQNCSNNNRTSVDLTFFRFPIKRPEMLEEWKISCGNPIIAEMTSEDLVNTLLCEKHFLPQHIIVNSKRKMLTKTAVPIPFDENSSDEKKVLGDITERLEEHGDDSELLEEKPDYIQIKEEIIEEDIGVRNITEEDDILPKQEMVDDSDVQEDAIELFFKSMASTVLTFPPYLRAEARMRVCQVVSEIEMRLLKDQNPH